MSEIEDRVALLERQLSLQTEALRLILEGHWQGADGAAGRVVELLGGEEIEAEAFPG